MLSRLKNNPVYLGMLFALGQSLFFTTLGMLVRLAGEYHHTFDMMFYRNSISLLIMTMVVIAMGKVHLIPKADLKRQIIRGCVGTIGMILTFAAFTMLPLSEAQSLLFAAPIFVVLLSYPVLKEKVGPWRIGAALTGFIGILLIVQPGAISSFHGGLVGLTAALSHAAVMLLLRMLGKSQDPIITVFYFSLISTLLMLPLFPFYFTMPTSTTLLYLIGIGIMAVCVQICLTEAYYFAPASVIAPITYLNLIWALIVDYLIWNHTPVLMTLAGAFLVIASNFVIVLRETRKAR
jgi:drug/metabolite transporter (DMT)-like permease